jgi:D-glycero-D-manno-heptose 1,7-bisphosphate phosphatase
MSRRANRAVFLDRDGVLNRPLMIDGKPHPPASVADLVILPDVLPSLLDLKRADFLLVVATNQPDVARGTLAREAVEAIHARLRAELPLDDILTCYHDDSDRCDCRKPLPGLLCQASRKYGLDLSSCFLVGDRWRDIDAGNRAGCRSILIDYGYRERRPERQPVARVQCLRQAVDWILEHE